MKEPADSGANSGPKDFREPLTLRNGQAWRRGWLVSEAPPRPGAVWEQGPSAGAHLFPPVWGHTPWPQQMCQASKDCQNGMHCPRIDLGHIGDLRLVILRNCRLRSSSAKLAFCKGNSLKEMLLRLEEKVGNILSLACLHLHRRVPRTAPSSLLSPGIPPPCKISRPLFLFSPTVLFYYFYLKSRFRKRERDLITITSTEIPSLK